LVLTVVAAAMYYHLKNRKREEDVHWNDLIATDAKKKIIRSSDKFNSFRHHPEALPGGFQEAAEICQMYEEPR
jgi:carbamoylphosphate synthase small subunit